MAHALLGFQHQRVIARADVVRPKVKSSIERIGTWVTERRIVRFPIGAIKVLKHRQMTPKSSLVPCPQQQAAKELALDTEIEVLARGVSHVLVHRPHRDAFARMRNWIAWVVCWTDSGRIGIENGI